MFHFLHRWLTRLLGLVGLIAVAALLLLILKQQTRLQTAPLSTKQEVATAQVDSPLPTRIDTPTAEVVYVQNTVFPTATPPPTLEPTPTSPPYPGLVVSTIEPIKTGPYQNILWSPDGKKALISKQYTQYTLITDKQTLARTTIGLGDLWLLDLSANEEQALLQQVGRYAWSPDSTAIVYINPTEVEGVTGMLYVYELGNGKTRSLVSADFLGSDYDPQWLSTGEIVYVRDGQLWAIQSNGSGEHPLLNFKFVSVDREDTSKVLNQEDPNALIDFYFSPTGKRIAYHTRNENIHAIASKLWLTDADGRNSILITGQALSGNHSGWSPNGEWLVFPTFRDLDDSNLDEHLPMGRRLWLVGADGSNIRLLQRFDGWGGATLTSWSPDNARLAFTLLKSLENGYNTSLWITDIIKDNKAGPLLGANEKDEGITGIWWEPSGNSLFVLKEKTKGVGGDYVSQRLVLNQK